MGDAIKQQNTLLENLTEVLSKRQIQPAAVPVQQARSLSVLEDEDEENCFHRTEESLRAHEVETARNRSAKENSAMVQDYYNPKKSETATAGALPGETGVFAALDKADSDEEEEAAEAAAAAQAAAPIQRQPRGPSATAVVAV